MNEGKTTAIFGIVAAIALGLAWWSKPEAASSVQEVAGEQIGQSVFPKFEDPGVASTMQIIKYDETLAQLKRFEVSRDNDTKLWTLPSHDGYPADAADQVKDATTPLIGLEILDVVAESAGDHELYGVVNPDDELAAGASGVGMLVRFKDDSDQVLASLIIGKEVDKAEGQRYVRVPTEDAVYQVEISTDAFTTNFKDWIEGELLGVRSMDITKVAVRDYSLNQGLGSVTLSRNFDAEAQYDAASSNWSLTKMVSYESGQPQPVALEEGESVNKQFLNALRTAVQDLEIVDVQRKPKGLAADLKVDDSLLKNNESIAALQQQGFFAASINNETEIFAAGGETIVGTEEGVDYLLRFGEATASLASMDNEDEDAGLSRYLLVTAKLDDSRFPAPELEPLPETVEEMLARESGEVNGEFDIDAMEPPTPPADAESPTDSPANEPSKAEPAADESKTEEQKSEEPNSEEPNADEPASEEPAADEPASEEPAPTTDEPSEPGSDEPAGDEPDDCGPFAQEESDETAADDEAAQEEDSKGGSADEPSAEPDTDPEPATGSTTENSTSDAGNDEAASSDEPQETEEEQKERLEAVREEIAKENQRKIDERNDKIEKARKKVLELNARFSEWYYVVGDSAYKKLKITREDLIEKADADDDSAAPTGLEGLNLNGSGAFPGGASPLPQLPQQ